MKIIYNKLIPFKGFAVINLFGVIFAREECRPLSAMSIRHEAIHTAQMRETGFLFFYIIYIVEYLILLCRYRNAGRAYRSVCFEKEAYKYQVAEFYLKYRKRYAWIRM